MKTKSKTPKPTLEDIVREAHKAGAKVTCSLEPNGLDKLHKQMHEFIDNVLKYAEDPASWPLTPSEQVSFIRTVMYQAKRIRNTEAYLAEACSIAADELALAS